MAKDNLGKRPDPGTAKTTESKPGIDRTLRKYWDKARWIKHAKEVGIKDAETMSVKAIQLSLKTMREEGKLEDGRKENGPKKTADVQAMVLLAQEQIANHAMGEVEILINDKDNPGAPQRLKVTRVEALMYKLYTVGVGGNVQAITAYLDRFAGKPKQSIEHTGEIKTDEQEMPTPEEQAAAKAYQDALEKGQSVKSPVQV